MNTSFGDSNLFQTLVLIVTIGATTGIALWQFHAHKRKELRNAVSILILQIKDIEKNIEYIEKNIEYIFSEGIIISFMKNIISAYQRFSLLPPFQTLHPYVRYYRTFRSNKRLCTLTFPIGCPQISFHRRTPPYIPKQDTRARQADNKRAS